MRQVPLLVISHFHADHVGGLAGVFRRQVLAAAAARGTPVRAAAPGEGLVIGDLRLTVLGPLRPLSGTRSDPNNNSLVLLAAVRGHAILLTGDAEEDEQQTLMSGPVHADVLKVAHHGSAFQDPAFLDAVRPSVALVSVGAGNGYGHPNAAVLARLAQGGARVLRTDRAGDVAAIDSGTGLAVVVRGTDRRAGRGSGRPAGRGSGRPP